MCREAGGAREGRVEGNPEEVGWQRRGKGNDTAMAKNFGSRGLLTGNFQTRRFECLGEASSASPGSKVEAGR